MKSNWQPYGNYCLVLISISIALYANQCLAEPWYFKGHAKYQLQHTNYPSRSLFSQLGYETTTDQDINVRLNAENRWDRWDARIHYQLIGIHSDSLELSRQLPSSPLFASLGIPSDETRLFDLTHVFTDSGKEAALHRLDRFSVGYSTASYVIRFGRDAVSWGNGLLYNPMDFFNPFEPSAVDKDYKTGDDMLYGQYLFETANDLQGVIVPRRDTITGDVNSSLGSIATKFHGFIQTTEYDLLLARHFADEMLGVGFGTDWRESVVRGDITLTNTEEKVELSIVANISYSWIWWDKNVSGFLEYFYNGFGQASGNYDPQDLASNTELLERILRGELFTLGRNYLAGSLTFEATPLLLLTPNLFINMGDPSALIQFTAFYDWKKNVSILGGFALPLGSEGTEFGGIPTGTPDTYLSSGTSLYGKISFFY